MNDITMLKKLMEDFDITELKQLYNELDSIRVNYPGTKIEVDISEFLEAPEAELAIQVCFNKEEYDEFVKDGKSAIEKLKESFIGL